MQTTNLQLGSLKDSSPCFKPTLMFITITSLTVASFVYHCEDSFALKFDSLENREFWRLITSPFASSSTTKFLANLMACLMLTIVSERVKGTVLYSCEFVLQILAINGLSVLLYLAMLSLADAYEGFFTFFVAEQNKNPSEGLQYMLFAELFQALSKEAPNKMHESSRRFSNAAITFMYAYSILLFIVTFDHLGFISAAIVGCAVRVCVQSLFSKLQQSRIVQILEGLLSIISYLVYLSEMPAYEVNYFESCELSSIQSNRDLTIKAVNVSNIINDLSLQSTDKTEENSKSRYDELNIQEFILNSQHSAPHLKHDESFEI